MALLFDSNAKKYLCNNCGGYGHLFYNCKKPITSLGIVCVRRNPMMDNRLEYNLVRRKDSMGYVDFLRGKFSENNDYLLRNIIKEMTASEVQNIRERTYKELWDQLWNKVTEHYDLKSEAKFNYVKRFKMHLFDENYHWPEPEWGFPKGRRNFKEKDLDCALREFEEETGYKASDLTLMKNLSPFEEIFTGSNLKSYKHRYFLAFIDYELSSNTQCYQISEIGCMQWFSYEEACTTIRPYNTEKIELLANIQGLLEDQTILFKT
jgi:8-oxo-dGTP pyrophosphatase MutT (NUDIX family)